MATRPNNAPLITLIGETASGKTALGLVLAERFNGEIIAADSRTVYKGMDIGTAKPSVNEQKVIRHHLIDVVNPDTKFSVSDFKARANEAIDAIHERGRLPLLVGGTGLYVDAVLYDFSFRPPPPAAVRSHFESLSTAQLQQLIIKRNLPMPRNIQNPRHLARILETNGASSLRNPLRQNTLIIGISNDRSTLRTKIELRVDAMLKAGLLDEVYRISSLYGWDAPGLQSPGYKEFRDYIEGRASLEQVRAKCIQNHWQLAKRQRTWFKRNKDIHWICKTEEAVDLVTTFLNK